MQADRLLDILIHVCGGPLRRRGPLRAPRPAPRQHHRSCLPLVVMPLPVLNLREVGGEVLGGGLSPVEHGAAVAGGRGAAAGARARAEDVEAAARLVLRRGGQVLGAEAWRGRRRGGVVEDFLVEGVGAHEGELRHGAGSLGGLLLLLEDVAEAHGGGRPSLASWGSKRARGDCGSEREGVPER